ncbi:DNA repair protein RecN (Recombination protein N) [Butyrivibrio hungatei DSM 14810]|uniref:DNA repair protein RecN n=1 Tax=Butyrivibrio hungatei DSM 14810 TaxID=1121132 RepID=A0A1M7S498_9FIRM|nr:DNA repair protein RecN [Butyrivibrio hungatei]SHN53296.1 DNA repair protein RecN (Recombination protein N) [Butyrivibrio hungatei DSM 14810]
MLYSLHVKNLALIKEQEIEFSKGLNILTGETGAGKSVIIGSVNLALGGKTDAGLIRTGEESALVELTFGELNDQQKKFIKDMDIELDEDGTVIIQRKIMPGRSVSKICGETVSARQLKDIASILINIHGQNDHQELLHKKKHMEILDDYCMNELKTPLQELSLRYEEMRSLEKELEDMSMDESSRLREQELLEFEVNEINDANVVLGEDEELESRYHKMVNSRKISEAAYAASAMTSGNDGEDSASDLIGRAVRELSSVSNYDSDIEDLLSQLSDIENLLTDFNHSLSDYVSDLEFDDEDFRNTEDRLNTLNHLKDKYGGSLEKVLEYLEEKSSRLEALSDLDAVRSKLTKSLDDKRKEVLLLCKKISDIRKKGARSLQDKLTEALIDLNFLDVRFEIEIKSDEDKISSKGYDDAQFMISTNPGEAMRPLDQIASGGELSRIMLALKTVVADKDDISTLIFDEIDAGISGRTAWKVSQKLGELSKDHQIICITHLPQIAAMSDTHFMIEKGLDDGRTVTSISKLDADASTSELARLLGGEEITDAVIQNALEMRKLAEETKRG